MELELEEGFDEPVRQHSQPNLHLLHRNSPEKHEHIFLYGNLNCDHTIMRELPQITQISQNTTEYESQEALVSYVLNMTSKRAE